jgi:hypothetical protein
MLSAIPVATGLTRRKLLFDETSVGSGEAARRYLVVPSGPAVLDGCASLIMLMNSEKVGGSKLRLGGKVGRRANRCA